MTFNQKIIAYLLILSIITATGTAIAAEYLPDAERYILPAGETLDDDLYIIAPDVTIEGTLNGDLIAISNFVRVRGEVNGDVLAVTGGFRLDGSIEDDAQVVSVSNLINGSIGDTFFTLDTGIPVTAAAFPGSTRTYRRGTFLENGQIGGDAIVIFSSFFQMLNSEINGDLYGTIFRLTMEKSLIAGDVDIQLTDIEVDADSRVTGPNGFAYRSGQPLQVDSSISERIRFDQLEGGRINWVASMRNVIGRIAGYAVLGWVLLRYRPEWLDRPVDAMRGFMSTAVWSGFSFTFFFLPVISLPIMLIAGFFWGTLASFAIGGFIFLGVVTIWLLSPILVGYWMGPWLSEQPFQGLIIGSSLISILLEVPFVNFAVSILVISLTIGGFWLLIRPYMQTAQEE
ncbi:MAG: hypothetical protein AAF633_00280 [Chloroflexota bacterium]